MSRCSLCNWSKNEFVNCTPFFGNPNAKILFYGEAFGKTEAIRGYAFCGDAGDKFNELLSTIGLQYKLKEPFDDSCIAVGNSMRCYTQGNITPNKGDLDKCFPFTYRDIQAINPELVVAMGGSALYQLTGKTSVETHLGKTIESKKIGNRLVYVTYHPAAILYDPDKKDKLIRLFQAIPSVIGKGATEIKHYRYLYINSPSDFNDELKQRLINADILYWDTEGTGLDTFKNKLTLFQISDGEEPVLLFSERIIFNHKDFFKYLLVDLNKPLCGQGHVYDIKMCFNKLGFMPSNLKFDTCLAEYILTGQKNNNLDYLTGKYVPESYGYSDTVTFRGGAHKFKPKDSVFLQYGSDDVGVLPKIRRRQYKQLINEDLLWLFENITMPCDRVLTKMSLRGVKYDLEKLWEIDSKYEKGGEDLLEQAKNLEGVQECQKNFKKAFNPKSYQMVSWLLFDYYKLPVLKTTKEGGPSTDEETMEKYSGEEYNNPYCDLMLKYRSIQTIRSGFLSGVLSKLDGDTAHTIYSLHSTTTGRPNSKEPNLLNIPHDDEIRSIIVARPGFELLSADLSQIEVRIAAMLSQDENLLEAFNNSIEDFDFHCFVAAKIAKIVYEEFKDKYNNGDAACKLLRYNAKGISFGVLYGMGPLGLARRLNITVEKATEFIDSYFREFKGLKKFMDDVAKHVIEHGWVDNYFGFRRRFKNHKEDDHGTIRESMNFPIQSLAWNFLQLSMNKIDKYLEDENFESGMLMQVYDQIVIESKKEETERIAPVMKEVMESVNKPFDLLNTVPVLTDVERGPNFGSLKKIL